MPSEDPQIGLLAENSLHAAIKAWYARPDDRLETRVENYVVDIVRGTQLIEVQTGNFGALKSKLKSLLDRHAICILYPLPVERWILRQAFEDGPISKRKSPHRGRVIDVFNELVSIPRLIGHPNLSLEVILLQEEVLLRDDGKGSWRRKRWSIVDRRLKAVLGQEAFSSLADYCRVLPETLADPFTNPELAEALGCRPRLAQKITYTLRRGGALRKLGKRGRAYLYERCL